MLDTLEVGNADVTAIVGTPMPPDETAAVDEQKITAIVAHRVTVARAIVIRTQEDLDGIATHLLNNKKLQKHFSGERIDDDLKARGIPVFDWKSIKRDMDAAKAKVLAQEHAVMDPLVLEEKIYKEALRDFDDEQADIAKAKAKKEREEREAEERRLLAEAEAERVRRQAEINAQLEREHAEEVERALNNLPADAPVELVQAICDAPAPEHVVVPLDVPILAPVTVAAPMFTRPKGLTENKKKKYKGELISISLLCRAVAEGKVPSTYVKAEMAVISKVIDACGGVAGIPGVKVVEDRPLSSVRL